MSRAAFLVLLCATLAGPAMAASYPVSGRWGESASTDKGPIDCTGKRVIEFTGNTRTDSKGGVPAYRNKSITPEGNARWRIVDVFTTGQISNAAVTYTLVQVDPDHIALDLQKGGTLKLQKCK
ncbi:hypothetical protein DW352_25085 [Pseudolabrys taiwanensis]|uniref:Secreted protein n=1 Tax=Pseudolabrys taiwanensis TaxID=331696 RepID=A0A346A2W5_9HYPH|nr:hypothetical protein [Pseudolabrys taiwanensis]AXK83512.1 hypothetical protein DW352_25085 [Pseudolabrys taiwanensis]